MAKTQWFLKSEEDETNQMPSSSELNISWSSSNSENESFCCSVKKFKISDNIVSRRWITSGTCASNSSIRADISMCMSASEIPSEVVTEDNQDFTYQPSAVCNPYKSPIISAWKLKELSPVLAYSPNEASLSSPTIGGGKRVENKIITKLNDELDIITNSQCSAHSADVIVIEDIPPTPEDTHRICMSSSQQETFVIENDSPKSIPTISSGRSLKSTSDVTIDLYPSESQSESHTSDSKSSTCHDTSPKKKKHYQKNKLTCLLQKALHKQKSDFVICQHELYFQGFQEYHANPLLENSVLELKIVKFWKEFGVNLVECEYLTNTLESRHLNKLSKLKAKEIPELKGADTSCNDVSETLCLVIVGFNVTHNVSIKNDAKVKLYSPYMTRTVIYNNSFVKCYLNVSKLFSVT